MAHQISRKEDDEWITLRVDWTTDNGFPRDLELVVIKADFVGDPGGNIGRCGARGLTAVRDLLNAAIAEIETLEAADEAVEA